MMRSVLALTPRWLATTTAITALAVVLGCVSTAPTDSTQPEPEAATTAPAPESGSDPVPTVAAAATETAPQTSDRGLYGGIVPMHDYAFPNLIFHPHEFTNQVKNWSGIYNGLLEYNAETDDPYDIIGDLAESWELLPDGVTYVFHLHDHAVWQDGTPVTADDVIFSMDSAVNEEETRPVTLTMAPFFFPGKRPCH